MKSTFLLLGHTLVFLLLQIQEAQCYNIHSKKALITGSSGGIGAGIAKALAKEGARILIHYHTRKEGAYATRNSIESEGGTVDGIIQCDFRSKDAIRTMFNKIDEIWDGEIDILVNNAGKITKLAVEDDDDEREWYETMVVNVHAPYQLSRLAHARMKKQENGGVIVNVSSVHGSVSVEYMTAYAASKAALDRLTAGLASEWAEDGIRVNAVAPGIVVVERTAEVLKKKEVQEMWTRHLPAGRIGEVDDIAHAVLYLCQNDWNTGSILTIDGGMSARANMPFRARPEKVPYVDVCTDVTFEK